MKHIKRNIWFSGWLWEDGGTMKKPVLVWKYEHLGEWQNGPAIDQWVSADS